MFPMKVAGDHACERQSKPWPATGLQHSKPSMHYVATCEINLPFLVSTETIVCFNLLLAMQV